MKINLADKPQRRWETITCPHGEFEVCVRNPSYEEQGSEGEAESWISNRIETAICDWRGVEYEDEKPIPFSIENLKALCHKFPVVFNQLLALANDAYRGVADGESKNSEPPSSDSSGDGE